MKAYIKGIGSRVPDKRVSNDELAKIVDTSDEWIFSHTGIKYRHQAEKDEPTSELAFRAAQDALRDAGMSGDSLDMILTATVTQDFIGFPSVSCLLQERLGAKHAAAMDIAAACSGFIYGLETARAFIEAGIYRAVLVTGAESLSKITNWNDRNTCVLLGDGAGSAIVCAAEDGSESRIIAGHLAADGSGKDALIRRQGGSLNPFAPGDTVTDDAFLYMDGRKVYNFAVGAVGTVADALLKKASLTISDIDMIVPHQANIRIIEASAKRLGLPMSKFYVNIDEYANTSSATIPIALADMKKKGLLKPGTVTLTVAFGGGLTCGGNIIRW